MEGGGGLDGGVGLAVQDIVPLFVAIASVRGLNWLLYNKEHDQMACVDWFSVVAA